MNKQNSWTPTEEAELYSKMTTVKNKRGGIGKAFKAHAKQHGRTEYAVAAHWSKIKGNLTGMNTLGAREQTNKPLPTFKTKLTPPTNNKLDDLLAHIENVTKHRFTPSEIVEIVKKY